MSGPATDPQPAPVNRRGAAVRRAIAALPELRAAPGPLVGAGKSASVHALGQDAVLKWFHDQWPWRAIRAEVAAARLAADQGVPTPRVLDLAHYGGRPGIVFERVHGVSLAAGLRRQPWRLAGALTRLVELHLAIHAQQGERLRRQAEMLSYTITRLPDEPLERRAQWKAQLAALGGSALCHNDFHAHNIMLRGDQMLVIDWGKGAVGTGLLDAVLAYLKMRKSPPASAGDQSRGRGQWTLGSAGQRTRDVLADLLAEGYANRYLRGAGIGRPVFDALVPLAEASLRRADSDGH